MQAVLFDLDGVLYVGGDVIPGAAEAVHWFQSHDIPHLFLTNTSARPRSSLVDKLKGFGIDVQENDFLTPPVATCQWLRHNCDKPIALFIPEATKEEFVDFRISSELDDNIGAVIIGDLGNDWSFEKINLAFQMIMENPDAHLIALGMTRYWKTENGLQLDAGPFVSALEYATGKKPVVLGKPAKQFYQAALARLSVPANETIMIGDDIKGDIKAAKKHNLHTVFVRTGKYTDNDLTLGIEPDAIIDSIKDLPAYWQKVAHIHE